MCLRRIEKTRAGPEVDIGGRVLWFYIPQYAVGLMESFLSDGLLGLVRSAGRDVFHQHFFLTPTSPKPVHYYLQGTTVTIPTRFLRSRFVKDLWEVAGERTLTVIQSLLEKFPVASRQLLDMMALTSIAHDPLHCVVGSEHHDMPTLPFRHLPGVFLGNGSIDRDRLYTSPPSFSTIDALAVWDEGTRFTFLQVALTVERAAISASEVTAILDALATTGRPLENVRFSLVYLVVEEEMGRDLARALSNGADWIRCGYQTNRTVEVEVGYAVVEGPLAPYVPAAQ